MAIGVRGEAPSNLADCVHVGTVASFLGSLTVGDEAGLGAGAVVTRNAPLGLTTSESRRHLTMR